MLPLKHYTQAVRLQAVSCPLGYTITGLGYFFEFSKWLHSGVSGLIVLAKLVMFTQFSLDTPSSVYYSFDLLIPSNYSFLVGL